MDEKFEQKKSKQIIYSFWCNLLLYVIKCVKLLTLYHPSQHNGAGRFTYFFIFVFHKKDVTCCAHNLRQIAFYSVFRHKFLY